jgi:(Z)-2-((N-methylformamido)methylene)-5-hydroxybutyrolactone dehydrogenase
VLRRLGQLLEEHAERLARAQTHENGKLITEMRMSLGLCASDAYFFSGLAETLHGKAPTPGLPNFVCYTRREPIGVVGAITPWNTPVGLLLWKLLPALAAGNTIVVKPSEVTPTSTLLLAELVLEAGLPPGVMNVVTGFGDPAGMALVAHPGVDKIAFTGSSATGAAIAQVAAARFARVTLELGGKSPNILFADADISNAVTGIMAGVFAAAGQTCMAGSRVFVQEGIYDAVAELLVERARMVKIGDPLDDGSQLPPVASRAQFEKVLSYVDVARADGAELLTGGRPPEGGISPDGFFVEPTVFGGVRNDMRIAQEEVFGPVACLIPFSEGAEAVALANDIEFGLAAGVWTENVGRAHRVASRLRAGTVWVNNYRVVQHSMPFGGYKASGQGRELGLDALSEYTEIKSVWIDTGNQANFVYG